MELECDADRKEPELTFCPLCLLKLNGQLCFSYEIAFALNFLDEPKISLGYRDFVYICCWKYR